jgi:hypothetical protein
MLTGAPNKVRGRSAYPSTSKGGVRVDKAIPSVCVFVTTVPIIKLFAWGEGDSGRHVLR